MGDVSFFAVKTFKPEFLTISAGKQATLKKRVILSAGLAGAKNLNCSVSAALRIG